MNDLEILGLHGEADALEGDGSWSEIMGAVAEALSAAGIKKSGAFNQALAARVMKRSPALQHINPNKKRRYTVGFGPTAVPPNSTVTVQAQPQCLFRGEKLINTGDATGLYIQGIFVGQKSQLPTFQNPIAVKTYDGGVLDNELMLDTCQPALFITFQVQNTTAATLTWSMSVVGHAVL